MADTAAPLAMLLMVHQAALTQLAVLAVHDLHSVTVAHVEQAVLAVLAELDVQLVPWMSNVTVAQAQLAQMAETTCLSGSADEASAYETTGSFVNDNSDS